MLAALRNLLMNRVVLLLAIALAPGIALAEGSCPPGSYPIGGQGVQGCAPIPTGGSEGASPTPTGRWIKTWGAVATSSTGDAGVSKGRLSKSEAVQESLQRCAKWGAADCKVGLAYKNQCVAAVAADKGLGTKLNTGATVEVAAERATQDCRKAGSSSCRLDYSACTEPYFEKF
jgi:hypothetical protein